VGPAEEALLIEPSEVCSEHLSAPPGGVIPSARLSSAAHTEPRAAGFLAARDRASQDANDKAEAACVAFAAAPRAARFMHGVAAVAKVRCIIRASAVGRAPWCALPRARR
jgi:hypothetical protein